MKKSFNTIKRIKKDVIRNMKKITSIISFLFGFLLSYSIYSINTGGNLKNYSLIVPLLTVAICSVIISVLLNRKIKDTIFYFFCSLLSSYFMCFCLMVAKSIIIEDFMLVYYSPIIFQFLLPMIFMSVFSVYLFFKEHNRGRAPGRN